MTTDRKSTNKERFPLMTGLITLVGLGIVVAASGFAYAASQETHDPFCASCHTQPESTFFERSTSAPATDLASFHTPQNTRCIDCHSGPGVIGRMQAELLGARNAAAWYLHLATQPAPLTFAIQDANCLKCHQDVTQPGFIPKENVTVPTGGGGGEGGEGGRGETGRPNHWHQQLAQWQAVDPTVPGCTTCHFSHSTGTTAQTGFEDAQTTTTVCNACHVVLRRGRG